MESLKELVSKVLGVDIKELNDDSSPDTISSWDSFNGLMLISKLEKNFNIKFTIKEVASFTKLKDFKEALKRYGIEEGLD